MPGSLIPICGKAFTIRNQHILSRVLRTGAETEVNPLLDCGILAGE